MMAERIYLLLGSNEGDRRRMLSAAVHYLTLHLARGTVSRSGIYETAAWGDEDQPAFLNLALGMDTKHPPEFVLAAAQQIEASFGRQRTRKWGQRTLDVDILFFGEKVIMTESLVVPHPQLQERRFALAPLAEIAPDLIHPILKVSISRLLSDCEDPLDVRLLEED